MIKLENITKYYYSSQSVTCALRKINLDFKIGEFIAITGESGSGKTTLLNIISGFDAYEDGEMFIDGNSTSYYDEEDWEKYRKDNISFIFQNYNLIESYSVLENVMVSYIIDGYSFEEAKRRAIEKLKLVGLDIDINKKTSKLSGGQKQRLAIARCLAKETNIIVADEPTGNLDDENGKSVLKLLKELSKDKLVIVVTHNITQIEPFITRKIRLHDGQIVSDDVINQIDDEINNDYQKVNKSDLNKCLSFSFMNFKSQPLKMFLIFILLFITCLSSFIFLGNFKANLDENKTKELTNSLFQNFDDTRLMVSTNNSDVITDEIINKTKIKNVVSVEKYHYITDVNYYRPDDYKFVIDSGMQDVGNESILIDGSYYVLKDHSHFMRSSYCLDQSMLKAGRLPENGFEMVVYSNDLNVLNKNELVMFRNEKTMGSGSFYKYDVKIVGILKENTYQTYFSDLLCQIMDISGQDLDMTFTYKMSIDGMNRFFSLKFPFLVVDQYIGDYDISFGEGFKKTIISAGFVNDNLLVKSSAGNKVFSCKFNNYPTLKVSKNALGVSEELFKEIYELYADQRQFALFINDYANTNKVQEELNKLGYKSISCFKSSVLGYDSSKVIARFFNLIISILALFFINIIAVLITVTILKIKKNDYLIFKFNGLTNSLCKKISYMETIFMGVMSFTMLIIICLILNSFTQNKTIYDFFKFINIYDYLIIFIIGLITSCTIAHIFSGFINKVTKVTTLKEE